MCGSLWIGSNKIIGRHLRISELVLLILEADRMFFLDKRFDLTGFGRFSGWLEMGHKMSLEMMIVWINYIY